MSKSQYLYNKLYYYYLDVLHMETFSISLENFSSQVIGPPGDPGIKGEKVSRLNNWINPASSYIISTTSHNEKRILSNFAAHCGHIVSSLLNLHLSTIPNVINCSSWVKISVALPPLDTVFVLAICCCQHCRKTRRGTKLICCIWNFFSFNSYAVIMITTRKKHPSQIHIETATGIYSW